MQLRLSLSSDSQSDESLQELTCEFCAALQREAGVIAARPEGPCSPGSKGDPITLGTLLLQFVAPAAITGLANVMRAYCERDSSLTFEFERPDGEKVVVTGKNVRREDLEKVIRMTETSAQFADGGGSKRYAVLIASSTFPKERQLRPLACPERDVDGLNAVLREFGGFDSIKVLKNLAHFEGLRQINEMLKRARKDDLALIYYSGHGKQDGVGRLHLATANTEIDALESTSMPAQHITQMMELSPSPRKVLILDCCFSGAVGKAFRSGIDDQLNMMSSGGGTYIMTASTAIETAQEKEGDDYGLFTKHLIRGISDGEADRDGDGYITIDELYDYAYEGVVEEGAQKPTKYCRNVEGDIYISRTGRDPRQDRAKKLKALLFKLNSANDIPDELFLQAHEVISRKRAELTDMQREQEVLLDQLLQGKLKPSEFTWKWARPQLRDTPPPKPAPRTTQFLAQLLTPRPAEEAHAKLIERIGEFRRLGRLVGEVMITGQFDKFRGKKDD